MTRSLRFPFRRLGWTALKAWRRQRRASVRPIPQPLILVSQIQRSGGTLLSQFFDGHTECFAHPYEITWGRPKKWNWPQLDLSRVDPPVWHAQLEQDWLAEYADRGLYTKGPLRPRRHHAFVFDRILQREIFAEQLGRRPPASQRAVLDAYLTAFFHAWLDYQTLYARTKKYVTGFTPRVVMQDDSVERFWRDYPDGYLITLVRHPAAWYASAREHRYAGELTEVMDDWRASTEASFRAKERRPDRVTVLRFEDLILRTESVMRRICQITGLTFESTLTEPTFNTRPIESNSGFVSADHVDPAPVDRHRGVLPDIDIERIESMMGALYRRAADYASGLAPAVGSCDAP